MDDIFELDNQIADIKNLVEEAWYLAADLSGDTFGFTLPYYEKDPKALLDVYERSAAFLRMIVSSLDRTQEELNKVADRIRGMKTGKETT